MLVVCADLYKMKVELHILTQTSMKEEFLMIFSPNKGNFRTVVEVYPIKQGLKRYIVYMEIILLISSVAEVYPIKQGLKLIP